jgi:fatty acid-binding protein DegV
MGYTIVTDSSANLSDEIIDQYNIQILSLMYRVGDKEYSSYIKGEKNDLAPLYKIMRNRRTLPHPVFLLEFAIVYSMHY